MEKYLIIPALGVVFFAVSNFMPTNSKTKGASRVDDAGCYYDKPKAVLNKICDTRECNDVVNKNIDYCMKRVGGRITTNIKHNDSFQATPYLTMDIMDDVVACISQRENINATEMFPYKTRFTEVNYSVRSKSFEEKVTCLNDDCSRKKIMRIKPVIGETKNLYYKF